MAGNSALSLKAKHTKQFIVKKFIPFLTFFTIQNIYFKMSIIFVFSKPKANSLISLLSFSNWYNATSWDELFIHLSFHISERKNETKKKKKTIRSQNVSSYNNIHICRCHFWLNFGNAHMHPLSLNHNTCLQPTTQDLYTCIKWMESGKQIHTHTVPSFSTLTLWHERF